VEFLTTRKISQRRACEILRISRSLLRYVPKKKDQKLIECLKVMAGKYPRFGVRRLHAVARRNGWQVNIKKVRRLCRLQGLLIPKKRHRKRWKGSGRLPCKAEYVNHVWSYDFVHDSCENGQKIKFLTVIEEYTRYCLCIEVGSRFTSKDVMAVLERLFAQYGYPTFIRSDNGPEFIANALSTWLSTKGVTTRYIEPGSPWQNAVDERFNGTVRDECLNMEVFHHVDHARALVKIFQRHYNQERPHSSLGYRTPQEIASKHGLEKSKNFSWKTNPLGSGTLGTKIFFPGCGTGITKLLKTIRSRK